MKNSVVQEYILYYKEQKIKFQLIKTSRRKRTVEIKILYGDVLIKSPLSKSLTDIEQLIKKNAEWILKTVKRNGGIKPIITRPTYKDNSYLPYLGNNFNLRIVHDNNDFTYFTGQHFIIHYCKNTIRENYEYWLFDEANKIFDFFIRKYCSMLKVKPKKIVIKKLKSRWGSATSKNIINLNLFLIKSPCDVIEYVILHEVCHLLIKNHSKDFWKLLGDYMPSYKDKISWLKINGPLILT